MLIMRIRLGYKGMMNRQLRQKNICIMPIREIHFSKIYAFFKMRLTDVLSVADLYFWQVFFALSSFGQLSMDKLAVLKLRFFVHGTKGWRGEG